MKNNLYKIFLFFSCILLFSCGFKVLDKSQINNFSIQKILTSGDRTINFKIKNYLLTSVSKDNQKRLIINLNTKKNKIIKEKNIKNEIMKYEISLTIKTTFNFVNDENLKSFSTTSVGDFLVGGNYLSTLNNEKKLIDNLVNNLSKKIINKISLQLNDI